MISLSEDWVKRCKECGAEIDTYQADNFNQTCSDCTRMLNAFERYKIMEGLLYTRNQFEASLIILSISCFVIGIFMSLIIYSLSIVLCIVGAIIYAIAVLHNRKTRKMRQRLKELKIFAEL